jgi:hypothetical protein
MDELVQLPQAFTAYTLSKHACVVMVKIQANDAFQRGMG